MKLRDFIEDSNIITEAKVSPESKKLRMEAYKDLKSLRDEIRKVELKAEAFNKKYASKIHSGKYEGDDWVINQKFRNVISKLKDIYVTIDNGLKALTK